MVKLKVDGASVSYGSTEALVNAELSLEPGELVTVLGPNGSGKTTLLRTMAGHVSPSRGLVYLDGRVLREFGRAELARKVSYTSPDLHSGFNMAVWDLVSMGRYPWSKGRPIAPRDLAFVEKAVSTFGLEGLASRELGKISSGERQRAILAMAYSQDAEVVLLDEPLSHLDLAHQYRAMKVFTDLADSGKLVVMTSHLIDPPCRFSDKLVVMSRGKVAALGRPREVLSNALIKEVWGVDADVLDFNGSLMVVVREAA